MCKKLSDIIHRFSTGWVALVALMIFLMFSSLVLPIQASKAKAENGDMGSPDLSFYYSADDLYRMAEAYGEIGRRSYVKARFTFDLVWPLVYTLFLITGISWVTRKTSAMGSLWLRANLVPIPGAIFDILENVSTSLVMIRYPDQTGMVDGLATVFTMTKWVFANLSFVLLLIGVGAGFLMWVRSKKIE